MKKLKLLIPIHDKLGTKLLDQDAKICSKNFEMLVYYWLFGEGRLLLNLREPGESLKVCFGALIR